MEHFLPHETFPENSQDQTQTARGQPHSDSLGDLGNCKHVKPPDLRYQQWLGVSGVMLTQFHHPVASGSEAAETESYGLISSCYTPAKASIRVLGHTPWFKVRHNRRQHAGIIFHWSQSKQTTRSKWTYLCHSSFNSLSVHSRKVGECWMP